VNILSESNDNLEYYYGELIVRVDNISEVEEEKPWPTEVAQRIIAETDEWANRTFIGQ